MSDDVYGKWRDWVPVTTGRTDTVVRRSGDGRTYAKTATAVPTARELADERCPAYLRVTSVRRRRLQQRTD